MDTIENIRQRFEALAPHLDERSLRLFVASETLPLGHGGVTLVSRATGLARSTIYRGVAELGEASAPSGRVRRPGGGRKPAVEVQDGLEAALDALVEPVVRGDPERPLRWVSKSLRHMSEALSAQGFSVSHTLVGRLLKQQGYTLQGNLKTGEGTENPDRDAQFHPINDQVIAYALAGLPVISVDTRKKELVGDFKNAGREWRPQGSPEEVRVHDLVDKKLGKAIPYGVYDVINNVGWVNVGISADTSAFAVESIRRWWEHLGKARDPEARKLLITADCGGSNGSRVRLWKVELQKLACELGIEISVCHLPPGTSKWNRIEHKLFSFISQNWRRKPLYSLTTIIKLIGATTTRTGLKVYCDQDTNVYPTGIKISKAAMAALNIRRAAFHGEWTYTFLPTPDTVAVVS